MTTIIQCEQRSPEWVAARVGKFTGSRAEDLAMTKKGESAARKKYKSELLCETLTGRATDHYVTSAMQWGTDQEPAARLAYEVYKNITVELVGFVDHPTIKRFGASPDGLVGEDGLVEFKCPTTAVHLEYRLAGTVPEEYQPQMLAEMSVTGRKWCDFVSFDPRLPKHLRLFVCRFPRDETRILDLEDKVLQFLSELDVTLRKLEEDAVGQ